MASPPRPLNDRIIVKRTENERQTSSGFIIPETAAEKPDQGQVIAVGPGKLNEDGKRLPMSLKVGDKVLFGKYAGQAIDELLFMREEDVLAVLAE